MYRTVGDFVRALDAAGELSRVGARVSPVLEIPEIADRMSKAAAPNLPSAGARRTDPRFHRLGGRALLFENVEGSDIPVLINALGSYRRMELALGCNDSRPGAAAGHTPGGFEALAAKIAELVKPQPPGSIGELVAKATQLLPLLKMPPKRRRGMGECQEVVLAGDRVDLMRLPLIRCWPLDGDLAAVGWPAGVNDSVPGVECGAEWEAKFRGRYITLGGVHTIHADDRDHPRPPSHNIGMYRVQLMGKKTMAMHWHIHHDGARHWRSWKERGEPMPVAIALGGESVLPYAATAPLPPGLSELLLAGFLNRRGIEMVRARTVPLWVPANAEIVIEGYVRAEAGGIGWVPAETAKRTARSANADSKEPDSPLGPGAVVEGPFGDHTGFYSMPDRYPVLTVTAITHRRDPIYPTTIVGYPPQEDYYLGKATERLFLPLLKTIVPDIEDYDLPMFGAFHNAVFVKVRKSYPLHARRVMHSVWGAGQMAWTKTVVVVDHDMDVHDTHAVLRVVGERCVPARDSEVARGPLDILDHAAPFLGAGMKMGLDATRKGGEAELHRPLEGLAAEVCAAGEIGAVVGEAARACEARVRGIEGVCAARVPEELGGWWLLVSIDKRAAGDGLRGIKALGALANEVALPRWTVVVGAEVDVNDTDAVMFRWMANYSPDRDRSLSVCGRRVAFDATAKTAGDQVNGMPVRAWPPFMRMSEEVRERVSRRWREYGLA